MAGKLSAGAAMKLASLDELGRKVQHIHGLVEQYAAAKQGSEQLAFAIRRAFGQLKLALTGAGEDGMAQAAAGLEIAAGRGAAHRTKTRILREGVGSLRFQLEAAQRAVVAEDEARQKRVAEREREAEERRAAEG